MAGTVDTLGDALPREIARVTELMAEYAAIGSSGLFGVAMMKPALARATKALAEGDVVAMIRCHQELKEFTG